MDRTLAELAALLEELDVLFPDASPGRRDEPDGREKFARRRKRRRARRLLERAHREGLFEESDVTTAPLFRVHEGEREVRVVVTHPDPAVTVDDGTVTVRAGDAERTVELAFDPSVERSENNGVTTLRFS